MCFPVKQAPARSHPLFQILRIVEGTYVDLRYTGGLSYIYNLLWDSGERDLVETYGIWLLGQDRDLALKVTIHSTCVRATSSQIFLLSYSQIHGKVTLSTPALYLQNCERSIQMQRINSSRALFCRREIR